MMGGFGMLGIGMLLFWLLIIGGGVWLVVTLVHSSQSSSSAQAAGQTPLDILKARYAKGEITKEQFEEMKRALVP